jgi:hypothetical protein
MCVYIISQETFGYTVVYRNTTVQNLLRNTSTDGDKFLRSTEVFYFRISSSTDVSPACPWQKGGGDMNPSFNHGLWHFRSCPLLPPSLQLTFCSFLYLFSFQVSEDKGKRKWPWRTVYYQPTTVHRNGRFLIVPISCLCAINVDLLILFWQQVRITCHRTPDSFKLLPNKPRYKLLKYI